MSPCKREKKKKRNMLLQANVPRVSVFSEVGGNWAKLGKIPQKMWHLLLWKPSHLIVTLMFWSFNVIFFFHRIGKLRFRAGNWVVQEYTRDSIGCWVWELAWSLWLPVHPLPLLLPNDAHSELGALEGYSHPPPNALHPHLPKQAPGHFNSDPQKSTSEI